MHVITLRFGTFSSPIKALSFNFERIYILSTEKHNQTQAIIIPFHHDTQLLRLSFLRHLPDRSERNMVLRCSTWSVHHLLATCI